MIAPVIPFRGHNFARELMLRKLEAEVRAERRPPHLLDVLSTLHSAPQALRAVIRGPIERRT